MLKSLFDIVAKIPWPKGSSQNEKVVHLEQLTEPPPPSPLRNGSMTSPIRRTPRKATWASSEERKEARILTSDKGAPLRFFLPADLGEREHLYALIRKHGGKVVSEMEDGAIYLADMRKIPPHQLCYSTDYVYTSIFESRPMQLEPFKISGLTPRKRTRISFTPEEDRDLFDSVLLLLDDSHFDPGERLFKALAGISNWRWKDMYDRYYELLEEPAYKKRKFAYVTERETLKSPARPTRPDPSSPPRGAEEGEELAPKTLLFQENEGHEEEEQNETSLSLNVKALSEKESHQSQSVVLSSTSHQSSHSEVEASRSERTHRPHSDGYVEGSDSLFRSLVAIDPSLTGKRAIEQLRRLSNRSYDEVVQALYACNGEVSAAKDYLLEGPEATQGRSWTKKEDDVILKEDKESQQLLELEKRRGAEGVAQRREFLASYNQDDF